MASVDEERHFILSNGKIHQDIISLFHSHSIPLQDLSLEASISKTMLDEHKCEGESIFSNYFHEKDVIDPK